MNARHLFPVPFLAAVACLALATSAALAERHDPPNRSSQAPSHGNPVHANPVHAQSHVSQVHATHSAHGSLAQSAMRPERREYQAHRAEAAYRSTYPRHPLHRHPAAVVIARPLAVYSPVGYDTAIIRIVNPVAWGRTASYMLDGLPVFLPPGGVQIRYRPCVITFDRGNGYGVTQLVLTEGTYTIGLASDGGWSLFRE